MTKKDVFNARSSFDLNGSTYNYYRLQALEEAGLGNVSKLPYSIKVLLESVLRQVEQKILKISMFLSNHLVLFFKISLEFQQL